MEAAPQDIPAKNGILCFLNREINFHSIHPVGAHSVRPQSTAVVRRAHNVRPYTKFFVAEKLCALKIDFRIF